MTAIALDARSSATNKHSSSRNGVSRRAMLAGRTLTTIAALFLTMDTVMKLFRVPQALEGTAQLGYPVSVIFPLGVVSLVMLVLLLIPRTALLGALLWTGYLGGAVATHVRIGNPLFSHVLFPVYVAVLIWGGLWLRDARLRALVPFRAQ